MARNVLESAQCEYCKDQSDVSEMATSYVFLAISTETENIVKYKERERAVVAIIFLCVFPFCLIVSSHCEPLGCFCSN